MRTKVKQSTDNKSLKSDKKNSNRKVVRENKWWCETCEQQESMTVEEMKSHVKEKHDFDPANFKGFRSLVCHLDGDTWFSYQYQWTLNHPVTQAAIVLSQYTVAPRKKDDAMSFA